MIVPPFEKDKPRKHPYIWATWLSKLLSGEERCWWRAWYKSHHSYQKLDESDERAAFLKEWTEKHDAMVQKRAEELRAEGYDVRVEEEGSFKIQGELATLAGTPDLVGIRGDEARVSDAKSGKKRQSDHWQVLLYMFATPLAWLDKTKEISGEVVYTDGPASVRPLGPVERDQIISAIKKVGGQDPPEAAPSQRECERCDIVRCPVRHQERPSDARRYF